VLRQLLQDHLDLRALREEQQARARRAPAAGTDGIARTRLETGHGRLLATLFGTVRVTRCAWRKPGAGNYCPADAAGLMGSQRAGADTCVRYLSSKHELLRYDKALQAGWPIATGIIEGAYRHLIADRLDIGGARWGLDGAEAVLTLRAVISNGDYPDVGVMPVMRAGPAGGHRLGRPRDRDNLRPRLR
jgi:hypothetical protein